MEDGDTGKYRLSSLIQDNILIVGKWDVSGVFHRRYIIKENYYEVISYNSFVNLSLYNTIHLEHGLFLYTSNTALYRDCTVFQKQILSNESANMILVQNNLLHMC